MRNVWWEVNAYRVLVGVNLKERGVGVWIILK